ncbi:hypothetical protein GCM10009678_13510 [Actinomadura kijaniata]
MDNPSSPGDHKVTDPPGEPCRPDGEHPHDRGPTFDPAGLSGPQRRGTACVVCDKRWPRPDVRIGRLPDGSPAYSCADCAPAMPSCASGPTP